MFSFLCYIIFSLPLPVTVALLGTFIVTLVIYLQNLFGPYEDLPKLHYRDSTLARYILKKSKLLSQPFRPPVWTRSPLIQTLLPSFLPGKIFHFEREFLLMKDRGVVALDWGITGARSLRKGSPVLFVLPGLTGDASGVTFLCHLAVEKGFRPVVFNKRGHGKSPLTTPKLQSFGDPSDFRQAVKYVRGKYPSGRITACGISAGSGLLISYLGDYGVSSYVAAAVCISPGYDAETLFHSCIRQPYNFCMLYSLKRLVSRHANALSKVVDVDQAMRTSTIAAFEESLYCKLYGYKDMNQYWEKNNPMRDIDDVSTPVLCINSLDDPVCTKNNIPKELFELYPHFMLVTTEKGGHCGFLEHPSLESWADKVAVEYLSAVLGFTDKSDGHR